MTSVSLFCWSLFTFVRYLHLLTYQSASLFTNTETRPSNTLNNNPRHYRPPYYIHISPLLPFVSLPSTSVLFLPDLLLVRHLLHSSSDSQPQKRAPPASLLTACLHWPLHCWLTACVPSFPPIHYYLPWLRGFLP